MKIKMYNSDFSSCTDTDVLDFPVLEGDKGVVALRNYLVAFSANLRQGNACAKDRGDVSGTGKKPYRQKGTGMARHGSKRSPIWTKGGVVFGPKPRDYSQKINKKIKRLALARALYEKAQDGDLCMVDKLISKEHKTKYFNELLNRAFGQGTVLFVDQEFEKNFVLASGNIGRAFMVDGGSLNAFDVVRYKNIVVSEGAMAVITDRLSDDEKNQLGGEADE